MTELTDRNCFTCAFATLRPGFFATDFEPAEEDEYDCDIGLPGALEHEVVDMPDCEEYILDPELTQ